MIITVNTGRPLTRRLLIESVCKDCQGMPANLDFEWSLLTYIFSFDLLFDGHCLKLMTSHYSPTIGLSRFYQAFQNF